MGTSTDVVVVKTAHYWTTLGRDIPLMIGLRWMVSSRVIQFHGSNPELLLGSGRRLFRAATRLLLATASGVLVLSAEEKTLWERLMPRTPVFVVKNPHRPQRRTLGAAEAGLDHAADSQSPGAFADSNPAVQCVPVVLFVGRLIAQKGVLDLVQAAGMLASSSPHLLFHVVVAGDGPEASSIRGRAREYGIADRVTLLGHVDSEALRDLYECSTMLVLPASPPEGFPTVIAEAMAAGLPIVTTPIRGAVDYLEHGVNALFVPPRAPDQLADAIRALLEDPSLRRSMGQANSAKVAIFAPETVAVEYLEALRQIVR